MAISLSPVSNGRWLWMMAALWIIAESAESQARLLNIGGSLNINYNRSTTFSNTDLGNTTTSIRSLNQQYGLNVFGDAYRLGGYRADVSWLDQVVNIDQTNQKNHFNATEYRLSMNLFPEWSPLSLTVQRTERRSDLQITGSSVTTKDHIDALGANWVVNLRQIPRLVLNYQQADLTTNEGNEFLTRAFSATTDTTMGATHLSAGYQFSESDTNTTSPSTAHGLNLDTSTQLRTSLTLTAFARYSQRHVPQNVAAIAQQPSGPTAGVSFFMERSYGAAVVYRPPLYWWDGMASYNYSETPFFNDFKSNAVQGVANLRYNEKTDSNFGSRYLHISITDSTINSESADATLNYRPIFGLTTGLAGSAGETSTRTTGAEDTTNLFQNYRYSIAYTRPWQLLQYRTSYNISYGVSGTQPTGTNSRDLANGITLGVDNTNTQIVHVGLNTAYSNIQRITDSVKTEQSTYLIQLLADSSYFKNLILMGDSLLLRSSVNYSDTTGFGVSGRVTSGDFDASYATVIGLLVNTNYRIEKYPAELLLDRQIVTTQIQYSTYLILNTNLLASVKDMEEDNRFRANVNVLEGSLTLNYQIGRLTLGVQYQEIETRSSGNLYGTRSIMARASRSF